MVGHLNQIKNMIIDEDKNVIVSQDSKLIIIWSYKDGLDSVRQI